MKSFARHLPHYLSLLGILAAGVIGFFAFQYDRNFQAAVAISLSMAYVSWGIVHHAIHKDLYLDVFVEYLIFAILGLVFVLSVIFRS